MKESLGRFTSQIRRLSNLAGRVGVGRVWGAVFALVGGSAIAQIISFAGLPFVTRLYSAGEFGIFGVLGSLLGIVSVVACLRLEIAIPLPEHDGDAEALTALAFLFSLVLGVATAVFLLAVGNSLGQLLGLSGSVYLLWLIPVGVILSGSSSACQYWLLRQERFNLVSTSRIIQAVASIGTQISFGLAGAGALGLFLGPLAFFAVGLLTLGPAVMRSMGAAGGIPSPETLRRTFLTYLRFPTYSAPEALVNAAGSQLPLLLIAALVSHAEIGFVALAARVMSAPVQLLGTAISQVYLTRASREYAAGNLKRFSFGVLATLIAVALPGMAILFAIAPWLFALLFGAEWERSGDLVRWMVPWFALQFLTLPLSPIFHILGRNRTALLLQLVGLAIRVLPIAALGVLGNRSAAEVFAVSSALFYGLTLAAIVNELRRQP